MGAYTEWAAKDGSPELHEGGSVVSGLLWLALPMLVVCTDNAVSC